MGDLRYRTLQRLDLERGDCGRRHDFAYSRRAGGVLDCWDSNCSRLDPLTRPVARGFVVMDLSAVAAQAILAGAQLLGPLFMIVAGFIGALFGTLSLILFFAELLDS
jgi:hypothetical protein